MLNRILIAILVCSSVLASCKSRKHRHANTPLAVKAPDSAAALTAAGLLGSTLKPWTWFSAKIDLELSYGSNKELKPSASIRMYRDSLIWISGGMFGFEGVRILIGKDSAVVLNKLEKTYTVLHSGVFKDISDVPLTVAQLQNLILARPVFALNLYKILSNSESAVNIASERDKFTVRHRYNRQFLTMDSTLVKDKTTPNFAEVFYSSYTVVNEHNFPVQTAIRASNGPQQYNILMRFSDMDFTTELTFPFTIPASYEKTK